MRIIILSAFVAVSMSLGAIQTVAAATPESNLCDGASLKLEGGSCTKNAQGEPLNNQDRLDKLIESIINIFSIIVGIVAVIMIIIGGFKFITSAGDSGRITSARQTIIYALIGLVIVALAQIIVRFILTRI